MVANISLVDEMYFAMNVTIHSFPATTWESIFHCGEWNTQRSPGIWLHPESGTDGSGYQGFLVVWSTTAGNVDYVYTTSTLLEVGGTYNLEMIVNQSWATFKMNGEVEYIAATSGHTLYDGVPCYLADPWYEMMNEFNL